MYLFLTTEPNGISGKTTKRCCLQASSEIGPLLTAPITSYTERQSGPVKAGHIMTDRSHDVIKTPADVDAKHIFLQDTIIFDDRYLPMARAGPSLQTRMLTFHIVRVVAL